MFKLRLSLYYKIIKIKYIDKANKSCIKYYSANRLKKKGLNEFTFCKKEK